MKMSFLICAKKTIHLLILPKKLWTCLEQRRLYLLIIHKPTKTRKAGSSLAHWSLVSEKKRNMYNSVQTRLFRVSEWLMSALNYRPIHTFCFVVLAYWNNRPQVDMSLHSNTISWSGAIIQNHDLLHWRHANHYITDVVPDYLEPITVMIVNSFSFQIYQLHIYIICAEDSQ